LTRAVDQDVDRAQRLGAVLYYGLGHARLGDVGHRELQPPSGALDKPAGGRVVVGQPDREHVRACLRQGEREGLAQAGVAAGDDGVPPGQREQVEAEVGDVHGSAAVPW